MAFETALGGYDGGSWGTISALVAADGSATHPLPRALSARPTAGRSAATHAVARDLADAVHAIGALHGRYPGVIDHALARSAQPVARDWLEECAECFVRERNYLAMLTAAAGPLPSTPGQAASEAAVVAQVHALEMLAKSDRSGCATGAAIALVLDWQPIRVTLDAAALRFGITPVPVTLPLAAETATVVATLSETPPIERAMAFGAQQLLAQHRGLWDLLEARASARSHL